MATLSPSQVAYLQSIDHDDQRTSYIIGNAACLIAAYISVILRFWSRHISKKKWGADDYTILISLSMVTAFESLLFTLVRFGMGRHVIWVLDIKTFAQVN
jgi:hypothetical protein